MRASEDLPQVRENETAPDQAAAGVDAAVGGHAADYAHGVGLRGKFGVVSAQAEKVDLVMVVG